MTLRSIAATRLPIAASSASFTVWGAGTDVGKTLISAAYAYYMEKFERSLQYIKPVQTGFPDSSDGSFVASISGGLHSLGPHAVAADSANSTIKEGNSRVQCHTLYAWRSECSPHLAVAQEGRGVTDIQILESVSSLLRSNDPHIRLIETAGGVSSPSPSGTLQCDLYRGLRMPAVLVGESKLGGISSTLAAYDSLILRGFEIAAIPVCLSEDLDNAQFLDKMMKRLVHWQGFQRGLVVQFPKLPNGGGDDSLMQWMEESRVAVEYLHGILSDTFRRRFERLSSMSETAEKNFWWPFTQHKQIAREDIAIIDSRYRQQFNTFFDTSQGTKTTSGSRGEIRPMFDACCSWWTQGVDNNEEFNLQNELVRSLAFGAGRFGHVIFPEAAHEPAIRVAQKILETLGIDSNPVASSMDDFSGYPWASRVFFSDDGSTAVEVALKMALGKFKRDFESSLSEKDILFVLGLSSSYHGDTLGAMDASEESIFNKRVSWYKAMVKTIDPPTLIYKNKEWRIKMPETWPEDVVRDMCRWKVGKWESYESVKVETIEHRNYLDCCEYYVNTFIDECQEMQSTDKGRHVIGSCIMEPVVQGAGGMKMVEPWFQRTVYKICLQRSIPVILDEVFTGFWRLGYMAGAKILGMRPDVACYGKLLTGGLVPLGLTLASEEVFDAFEGDGKEEALLHGHSFTAYPAACSVAVTAMNIFHAPRFNPNIVNQDSKFEVPNLPEAFPKEPKYKPHHCMLRNLWDKEVVDEISQMEKVEGVIAIGTLLAVTLKVDGGKGGYGSTASREVVMKLRRTGIYTRPLGNVVYIMVAPNTERTVCDWLVRSLKDVLES